MAPKGGTCRAAQGSQQAQRKTDISPLHNPNIMMKKLLLSLLTMTMALPMAAQDVFERNNRQPTYSEIVQDQLSHKPRPYVRLGGDISWFVGRGTDGMGVIAGVMAEAGLEIPMKNRTWGFQPALRYITKGSKAPWETGGKNNTTLTQPSLEIPLFAFMRMPLNNDGILKMALGPYLCYGLSGTAKHDRVKHNLFGTGPNDLNMRRFDVGTGFEFSYQKSHFEATLGVETGFIPVHEGTWGKDDRGNKISWPRHGTIYLNVGYVF